MAKRRKTKLRDTPSRADRNKEARRAARGGESKQTTAEKQQRNLQSNLNKAKRRAAKRPEPTEAARRSQQRIADKTRLTLVDEFATPAISAQEKNMTPSVSAKAAPAEKKASTATPRWGKDRISIKSGLNPRNVTQALVLEAASDPSNRITFCEGVAGGGKTFLALWAGIEAYNRGEVDKILFIVPLTSPSRIELGFYPGTIDEKLKPYVAVLEATLEELVDLNVSGKDTSHLDRLMKNFPIEVRPTNHERGMTYKRTFVVIDEAHNLTPHETDMLVSRMGEGGRYFITGEVSGAQNDSEQLTEPGLRNLMIKMAAKAVRDRDMLDDFAFINKISVTQYKTEDSAARDPDLPHILEALGGGAERDLDIAEYKLPNRYTEEELASLEAQKKRKDVLENYLRPECVKHTLNKYLGGALERWPDQIEKLPDLILELPDQFNEAAREWATEKKCEELARKIMEAAGPEESKEQEPDVLAPGV